MAEDQDRDSTLGSVLKEDVFGREEMDILAKVEPRFGSVQSVREWYETQPLPGFSGATAAQLARAGRADEVLAYIDAVDHGVHSRERLLFALASEHPGHPGRAG